MLDTLEAGQFGDVWAPWYTLHKILAGLLDWCAHAGLQPEALQAAPEALQAAALGHRPRPSTCVHIQARARRAGRRAGGTAHGPAARQLPGPSRGCGDGQQGGAVVAGHAGGRVRRHRRSRLPAARALARGAARNATAAADALGLARAFHRRAFLEPLQQGRDGLRNLHANTHIPTLVAAARGAEVDKGDGGEGGEGGGRRAAALLTSALNAYCLLQLGYAYAGR